jgi:hypothetical protein
MQAMQAMNFRNVRSAPEFITSKKSKFTCTYGKAFQDFVVSVAEVRLSHVSSVKKIVLAVTSTPACRKTLRGGTTSWFGGLKSPPHKYIKL